MKPDKINGQTHGQTGATPADVMLTKEELAAKLKVAIRTIENWQHEGYLPFIKVANVVMFYWPTVLTHLQTRFAVRPRGVVSPSPCRTCPHSTEERSDEVSTPDSAVSHGEPEWLS